MLWYHTIVYCDVILTDWFRTICQIPKNWSLGFFLHRLIDYTSLTIGCDSRRYYWIVRKNLFYYNNPNTSHITMSSYLLVSWLRFYNWDKNDQYTNIKLHLAKYWSEKPLRYQPLFSHFRSSKAFGTEEQNALIFEVLKLANLGQLPSVSSLVVSTELWEKVKDWPWLTSTCDITGSK